MTTRRLEDDRGLAAGRVLDARAGVARALVPLVAADRERRVLHVAAARLGQRSMMELAVVGRGERRRQARVDQVRLDLLGHVDHRAVVRLTVNFRRL